ncbi:MAG: hypothetical protein HGA51_01595 [Demequinaceae bacterium]|nr:hypothetical protein [Demequinaceae bacterium]
MPAYQHWSDAMRRPHLAHVFAVAAVCAMFTAGCDGGDSKPTATVTLTPTASLASETPQTETPQPSQVPPTTAAPLTGDDADATVDAAPFPADTAPDTADASAGAFLSPVNLRFGVHDGFDRVVLDLEGTGQPGWLSQYVDEPRAEGSGETVDLEGAAFLQATVKGVVYPTEAGAKEYAGPHRFQPATAGIVEEVVYGSVFEGQVDVYVGLSSKQPFRVFLLEGPTRVVIDIYHP